MFVTLPLAFARMPLGASAAIAFFVLLTLAALASAMSLLEMPVSLALHWLGSSRPKATLASAPGCWALGLAAVLSFSTWSARYPLARIPGLTTELGLGPGTIRSLTLVLRYVAPIGILAASVASFVLC